MSGTASTTSWMIQREGAPRLTRVGRALHARLCPRWSGPVTVTDGDGHAQGTRSPHSRDIADPGPWCTRSDDLRREGPGHGVRADRAVVAPGGCAERAGRAAG